MDAAKEVTGFSEDQIQIHTTMLGGSFGRKSTREYVEQALIISKFIHKASSGNMEPGRRHSAWDIPSHQHEPLSGRS